MKKFIALILTLLVVLPICSVVTFAGGTGASDTGVAAVAESPYFETNYNWAPNADGIYEIKEPGDLLAFLDDDIRKANNSYSGKTIVLTNDIDMNPGWDAQTRTTPTNVAKGIFYMRGTFDGQGHTISGLCIIKDGDDNACMVTLADGATTFQNLNIVNSYFSTRYNASRGTGGTCAGILAAVRHSTATFANIYLDAICEADNGVAGGFISRFNSTGATLSPSAMLVNCVFAGTVTATDAAGGIVGTNNKPYGNKGTGAYAMIMYNCANYGTVTSTTADKAGGLVGCLANEAVFISCYNGGQVESALFNLYTSDIPASSPVIIAAQDCYYESGRATTSYDSSAVVSFMYSEDMTPADPKTASRSQLLELETFKNNEITPWVEYEGMVIPAVLECQLTGSHSFVKTVVPPHYCIDGYTKYECSNCGYYYEDDVVSAPNGHYYELLVVEPTCTEEGYTVYTCSVCGDFYTDNITDPAHKPGDWVTTQEATCTSPGISEQNCTVCGYMVDVKVFYASHKYVATVVAPTCTKQGYTEHKCSVCGHSYKDSYVQTKPHSYVDTVVAPTCTKEGHTEHKCSVCGHTYNDTVVQPTSHSYVDTVVAPTCTEKGYTEHKCSVCGNTYKDTEVDVAAHTESDWLLDNAPTSEFSGKKHKECTVCGALLKTEFVPPIQAEESSEVASDTTTDTSTDTDTSDSSDNACCEGSIALGGMALMTTVLSLGTAIISKKKK